MDKKSFESILKHYDNAEVLSVDGPHHYFLLKGKKYCLYKSGDEKESPVFILVDSDAMGEYPHVFQLMDMTLNGEPYKVICLHENNDTINYLLSEEEKFHDAITRLERLISLNPKQREEEYQKEFLYYWNNCAEDLPPIDLFVGEDSAFKEMNMYVDSKGKYRVVTRGLKLNDAEDLDGSNPKWKFVSTYPFFFIPIIDNRDVLPPTREHPWDKKIIQDLFYGTQFDHISEETFKRVEKTKVKAKQCGIVFNIVVNRQSITFTTLVHFKSKSTEPLITKILNSIEKVDLIKSNRRDYFHLSKRIGNDTNLMNERILLVGAGSLGSYVAKEVVKAGICNLTIYDAERLEPDNLLRHASLFTKMHKAEALKFELQFFHEEIHVNAECDNISVDKLVEEAIKHDIIIFTVGESDFQLAANKALQRAGYSGLVFFTWLEAGGEYSHILAVNYKEPGCFECLYTDENGKYINNKSNMTTEVEVEAMTIRTGCGGTRVAYGNVVLLRTAGALLDSIKEMLNRTSKGNKLVDISSLGVSSSSEFVVRVCDCCGSN